MTPSESAVSFCISRVSSVAALLLLSVVLTTAASAQASGARGGGMGNGGTLGACLSAASAIKSAEQPGDFTKVEYLNPSADGGPTYEIELRDASGQEWEFMCNASSGQIYEIEQEASSVDDPRFDAGVGEDAARETVLDLYGGEVGEVEYEIESNGQSSYEIDVYADGTEWKIEVDAASGEIIEVHVEKWEIGMETDERME